MSKNVAVRSASVLVALVASTFNPASQLPAEVSNSVAPYTVIVHGHRGSRATRPENTIPAFQFAIDHGVDVLELDLAVTKDNVLVVSHSPFLVQPAQYAASERVCKGPEIAPMTPIHAMTFAQVEQYDCGSVQLKSFPNQLAVPGTHVASFDQVLDLAATSKAQLNVETKSFPSHPELAPAPAEFVRLILDAIHRHHIDESRIILQSFDYRTLAEMRKLDPAIRLSALVNVKKWDALVGVKDSNKDFVHIHDITGAEIISPDFQLVTPEQVAAAHKANMQVVPYTANTPAEWQKLVDAHVDGIITDDPEALIAWLRTQNPPLH
jgi:glycerophosphoryl diester phosphodiesterase